LRTTRLRQLSRERPGRRHHLTVQLAALVIAAASLGCDTSKTLCGGIATCYSDQGAQCLPGCTPKPVCMTNPKVGQDCATAATETDCLANILATGCQWSNGVCSGPCSQATDTASCQAVTWACSWSACSGNPKPCSAYSAAACPTSALGGCSVVTVPNGRLFE
jgi:hypothetical protein